MLPLPPCPALPQTREEPLELQTLRPWLRDLLLVDPHPRLAADRPSPRLHGAHHESFRPPIAVDSPAVLVSKLGYDAAGLTGNPCVGEGAGFAHGRRLCVERWSELVMRRLLVVGPIRANLTRAEVDEGARDVVASLLGGPARAPPTAFPRSS